MKIYNKLIALVAAFGLVGVSYAQDAAAGGNLTDNISIAGFVDASYAKTEVGATDTETIGVDEVEIDFLFGFGSVNSEVHLDSDGNGGNIGVEQAWVSYDVNPSLTVSVGKYGSALGLEREDPAGLYTYSRAYNNGGLNLGNVDANVVEGVAFSYTVSDDISARVSFQDSQGNNIDTDKLDVEISVSYTGVENVNIGGGYISANGADAAATGDVVNVHATYTAGKALIGAEYVDADATGTANDIDAWMILVDYDLSDKLGVALRLTDEDATGTAADADKFTIAPNYAITDDLGAILEYSDGEVGGTDNETLALELTLTF